MTQAKFGRTIKSNERVSRNFESFDSVLKDLKFLAW